MNRLRLIIILGTIVAVYLFCLPYSYAVGMVRQYYVEFNEYVLKAEELVSEGNYSLALEMYEKARFLYEAEKKELGVLLCIERMGWFKRELGQYGEALKLFQKAHPLGVRLNGDAAEIDADIGDVYMFSGDSEKAEQYYQRVLDTLKDFKFKISYASPPGPNEMVTIFRKCKAIIHARSTFGMLNYLKGEYDEALKHLKIADGLIDRIWKVARDPQYGRYFKLDYDIYNGVGYSQTIMGAVYGELGQFDKAQRYFSAGKGAFKNGKRYFGLFFNQALKFKVEAESPDIDMDSAKLKEIGRFLEEAEQFGATELVWRVSYETGRALKERKEYSKARGYLAKAIEALELTRSRLREDTLKKMFASSAQDVYAEMIDLLLEVNDAQGSFNYFERSRARAFLDILAGRSVKAKKSVEPGLIEKEKDIQEKIATVLRKFRTTLGPKRKDVCEEYKSLLSQRQEILKSIKDQSLEFASTTTVATIPAERITARLGKNTALVSYFLSKKKTIIWVVKEDAVDFVSVDVGCDELTDLVADYRKTIAKREAESIFELENKLYGFLIAPVREKLLEIDRLFIVPSKVLHYLPFASLHGPQGRFLVEDFALSVLPSASSLFFLDKEVTSDREHILAFGNPEREEKGLSLKFAEDEVRAISENFPKSRVLTGRNAAESVFKEEDIIDTGIIHVAAHGVYYLHDPLKSALLLAADQKNDGNLETFEIFSLTMNPRLVVLSACESGIGQVEGGDEVQSLSRAFLYAGAGGVLVSLWNVNDKATALLMKEFYNNLKRTDETESLRLAQMELSKNPDYKSAYYWAAFYLIAGKSN
ncbi:MAG: CHAT domain-containing protein [Candidatus Omnitrophica bacterium]|nr:CHAT domain-containing protein [Candidatus Omnitrophota bacterium]